MRKFLLRIGFVAPMIDWTDRHCRYFHRLLSPHALLYTEMITTGALLKGKRTNLLDHSPEEHPIALQLGGASPADLAESAAMGEDYGYSEIVLTAAVRATASAKAFGACLMNTPGLVAETVAAMSARVTIPVTIKCRIGVDESEDYVFLEEFIRKLHLLDAANLLFMPASMASRLSPKKTEKFRRLITPPRGSNGATHRNLTAEFKLLTIQELSLHLTDL